MKTYTMRRIYLEATGRKLLELQRNSFYADDFRKNKL
jgi:hypothetical protein